MYKVCPRCNLNYIKEDEELCLHCRLETGETINAGGGSNFYSVDFSKIVRGVIYGTNTRTIYEEFCKTLGWDKSKSDQFGWRTPLYAKNANEDRTMDVWFIFYPNYDTSKLTNVVGNAHVANVIQDNGDTIIEVVQDYLGKSNDANRITFVKTKNGYEFLGVYKIVENGTLRVYKRISLKYPM